jgi:serine phosphatase RsbU (regulator of sigma subunit)
VERTDFVPVGTPIDLENCDREPIHIPGSVQPHGVLLALRTPGLRIAQISRNAADLLGLAPDELLDEPLGRVLADESAAQVEAATGAGHAAPLILTTRRGVLLDGLVHESGGLRILEVERASEGITLANTYHAVRESVAQLGRSEGVEGLKEVAVREFRRLTGFDRVMYYRFDGEWNGEVVAEHRRPDLEPFLGLNYPASDIPAQARALYARNWLRFIGDRTAAPAPLVPANNPLTGEPLDLSHSVLRSVSPIHLQYLANMGVDASMSVSLLDGSELMGLIACHHYSGPLVPPAALRATCEFLAQTVSTLLVTRRRERAAARSSASESLLHDVTAALASTQAPFDALVAESPRLLRMLDAEGLVLAIDGAVHVQGAVPDATALAAIVETARAHAGSDPVFATDSLAALDPSLARVAGVASGIVALFLEGDDHALFVRPERVREVHWAGDPYEKPVRVGDDGVTRLSPRGSFALWKETVRSQSRPWSEGEVMNARYLRRDITRALLRQARSRAAIAEALQEGLLPSELPATPGWRAEARYRPASIGVGGDWYDVMPLGDGRVACVVGDISGHGLLAAGRMSQMRNALRAYLFQAGTPAGALALLDEFVAATGDPESMCTVAVAVIGRDGQLTLATAGHPPALLRTTGGHVERIDEGRNGPIGIGLLAGARPIEAQRRLEPGDLLLLFSDGLVERRGEMIDAGYERLGRELDRTSDVASFIESAMASAESTDDDVTILALERLGD